MDSPWSLSPSRPQRRLLERTYLAESPSPVQRSFGGYHIDDNAAYSDEEESFTQLIKNRSKRPSSPVPSKNSFFGSFNIKNAADSDEGESIADFCGEGLHATKKTYHSSPLQKHDRQFSSKKPHLFGPLRKSEHLRFTRKTYLTSPSRRQARRDLQHQQHARAPPATFNLHNQVPRL